MTKAQAGPQISYDHGVSQKKLIGETIGAFFDRTVETYRDGEALVVKHQNVRWSWGELGRRVDALAAGLMTLGLQRAERVGMDTDPVRHRQGGSRVGQRQPGLPAQ